MASVKISEIKDFKKQLKEIDENFEVDIQYWVCYGKAAARKEVRKDNEFVELSIYYNYKKDLVCKISKNKIVSENEGCRLSTEISRIKEDFIQVKQASKKNILEKVKELKDINLTQYI